MWPGAATSMQASAEVVGKKVAELCLGKNIEKVCFDRGGFKYHGRVKVRRTGVRRTGVQELGLGLCPALVAARTWEREPS